MSLPVIPKKFFDVKSKFLPKGKVTLSPFTVGLEDILLQVKDSEDEQEKADAIGQVVQSCIQTPGVEADKFAHFVLEEIFLRLRQHSIGELIDQQYQCTNLVEKATGEAPCDKVIPVQIDLREFKVVEPEGHTNVVMIDEESQIGIKFRYPSLALFRESGVSTESEKDTIISCIESIFQGDSVHPAADEPRSELVKFWDALTLPQKKDVFEKFFQTMPHLHYQKSIKCPSCGHVHEIEFNSAQEVFL